LYTVWHLQLFRVKDWLCRIDPEATALYSDIQWNENALQQDPLLFYQRYLALLNCGSQQHARWIIKTKDSIVGGSDVPAGVCSFGVSDEVDVQAWPTSSTVSHFQAS
jgi:hypothetical protein